MACGTPVVAFKRGSMPEVIKDEKTGFVVNPFKNNRVNYKDFIAAIKNLDRISRKDCRKWVEEKFAVERMVDDYENLYYKIATKQQK